MTKRKTQALVTVETGQVVACPVVVPKVESPLAMIERLAMTPGFDPANLEKLIHLHEHTEATAARKRFFADFALMQQDIPAVFKSGLNKHTQVRYSKNHDIQSALRPVLFKHGFGISFRTSMTDTNKLRVVLVLAHRDGHAEESEFVTSPDTGAGRNDIQAIGSAQSYAQRYLTLAMVNVTSQDDPNDDDGMAAHRHEAHGKGAAQTYTQAARPSQRPATRRSAPPPSHDADEPPIEVYDESEPVPEAQAAEVAAGTPLVAGSGPVINDAQRRRLYAILTNTGRNEDVVKVWLKTRYGYGSSKDIHQMHYETICTAIETPGRLPL